MNNLHRPEPDESVTLPTPRGYLLTVSWTLKLWGTLKRGLWYGMVCGAVILWCYIIRQMVRLIWGI